MTSKPTSAGFFDVLKKAPFQALVVYFVVYFAFFPG